MTQAINEINQLLEAYFDGLYYSDVGLLGQVFHPSAQYVCATDAPLTRLSMPEYFAVVEQRQAPADLAQPRCDRLLALTFAGPNTALAQVQCAIAPKVFTDFLSLIYNAGRWQIIAKVFHYELMEG